jgi:hypothetical protein
MQQSVLVFFRQNVGKLSRLASIETSTAGIGSLNASVMLSISCKLQPTVTLSVPSTLHFTTVLFCTGFDQHQRQNIFLEVVTVSLNV